MHGLLSDQRGFRKTAYFVQVYGLYCLRLCVMLCTRDCIKLYREVSTLVLVSKQLQHASLVKQNVLTITSHFQGSSPAKTSCKPGSQIIRITKHPTPARSDGQYSLSQLGYGQEECKGNEMLREWGLAKSW